MPRQMEWPGFQSTDDKCLCAYEIMTVSWFLVCSTVYHVFGGGSKSYLPFLFKWCKEKSCPGKTNLGVFHSDLVAAFGEVPPPLEGLLVRGEGRERRCICLPLLDGFYVVQHWEETGDS